MNEWVRLLSCPRQWSPKQSTAAAQVPRGRRRTRAEAQELMTVSLSEGGGDKTFERARLQRSDSSLYIATGELDQKGKSTSITVVFDYLAEDITFGDLKEKCAWIDVYSKQKGWCQRRRR